MGDYDNDGDLTRSWPTQAREDEYLLRNDGGGTLTRWRLRHGGRLQGGAWGDYDNDGDLTRS